MKPTLLEIIKSLNADQMACVMDTLKINTDALEQALTKAANMNKTNEHRPKYQTIVKLQTPASEELQNYYNPRPYLAQTTISLAPENENQTLSVQGEKFKISNYKTVQVYALAQNQSDAEFLAREACLFHGYMPIDTQTVELPKSVNEIQNGTLVMHGDWERTMLPKIQILGKNNENLADKIQYTDKHEPQYWIKLSDNSSLEITLESYGLRPYQRFYTIQWHCSEEDFNNNKFAMTNGIIETITVDAMGKLQPAIDALLIQLKRNNIYPVPDKI